MNCPCGNTKKYEECCGLYHSEEALAPTAEALMRARYSAFVKNQMDYLSNTTDPQTTQEIDEDANQEWADVATFQKLEIIKAEEKATKGIVEFKAYYAVNGENYIHHEISTFRKQAGEWFFKSGKVKETGAKKEPKELE